MFWMCLIIILLNNYVVISLNGRYVGSWNLFYTKRESLLLSRPKWRKNANGLNHRFTVYAIQRIASLRTYRAKLWYLPASDYSELVVSHFVKCYVIVSQPVVSYGNRWHICYSSVKYKSNSLNCSTKIIIFAKTLPI